MKPHYCYRHSHLRRDRYPCIYLCVDSSYESRPEMKQATAKK